MKPVRRIFSKNNNFFQLMERAANFCILNILALFCCFPIVTAGAGIVAAHTVMQKLLTECEVPVTQTFFRTFKEKFKHATLLWLLALVATVLLVLDIGLIYANFRSTLAVVMYVVLGIISLIALGTIAFAFPLISRYDNTFREHLGNAFYLATHQLPRTVAMVVIYLSPVLIFLCSAFAFHLTIPLWVFLGISSIIMLQTRLTDPIFKKLEQDEDTVENKDVTP